MHKSRVTVKNPCSKNWNSFEQREDHRFCQSCNKDIVDFREMSDSEIISYLNNSNKSVCGLINRATPAPTFTHKKSLIAHSLIAVSAFLFGVKDAVSQNKIESNSISVDFLTDTKSPITVKTSNQLKVYVTGVVTDNSGEGLKGVNVVIKGTTIGTQTNKKGEYGIEIQKGSTLIFSYVGFKSIEIEVGARTTIDVTMGGSIELGEMVITSYRWYTPRGIWQRIKRFF